MRLVFVNFYRNINHLFVFRILKAHNPQQQQQQQQQPQAPVAGFNPNMAPSHYHQQQQQQQGVAPPPPPSPLITAVGGSVVASSTPLPVFQLPLGLQPEYKLFEMNKRLSLRPDYNEYADFNSISLWWDAFVNEFFDDSARLTIRNVIDEHGTKSYTIGRTLIPRFFRSFNEGGVTDLHFQVARCQTGVPKDVQSQAQSVLTLETDMCTMNTKHGRPMFAKICTEGQLFVEFLLNNPEHGRLG